MTTMQQNWYFHYDAQSFDLFPLPDFRSRMFTLASTYRKSPSSMQSFDQILPPSLLSVANAVQSICQLLYNFFYVQQRLTSKQTTRAIYYRFCELFLVQTTYTSYFFTGNQTFAASRLLACTLRLSRLLTQLPMAIREIKKSLDKTFLDNLAEVYTFISQKCRETLAVQAEGDGKVQQMGLRLQWLTYG